MSNDEFTPEEIAALPQTTTVFDRPQLVFDQHEWQQQGYYVSDVCNPTKPNCEQVGIPIPSGKMLIKDKGGYRLIDERRSGE